MFDTKKVEPFREAALRGAGSGPAGLEQGEAVADLITRAAEANVLIAINMFMATEGAVMVYLPAEVALARLSLRAGLQDTFQAFPEPGPSRPSLQDFLATGGQGSKVPEATDKETKVTTAEPREGEVTATLAGCPAGVLQPQAGAAAGVL